MWKPTVPARNLAAVAALSLVLGGCSVSIEDGRDGAPGSETDARSALEDGVSVDLATPPTRTDLGLREGETRTVLSRSGEEPFPVSVVLHNGTRIEVQASALLVQAPDDTAAPDWLGVRLPAGEVADLPALVDDAVTRFGVPRDRADELLAAAPDTTSGDRDLMRVLTGEVSPDLFELNVVVSALEGRVVVTYQIGW